MGRCVFTTEFKHEAVTLVLERDVSVNEASRTTFRAVPRQPFVLVAENVEVRTSGSNRNALQARSRISDENCRAIRRNE